MNAPISNSVRIAAELRQRLATEYNLAEDDEAISDTVEGECDLPEQIARLARETVRTEAFADAIGGIIKTEQDRARRLWAKSEKLRALIAWALAESGFQKMPLPDMTLTLSKGKTPLIVNEDAILARIPPEFKRVAESLDKTAIRAALVKGEKLDFACLGNAEPTLTIRRT